MDDVPVLMPDIVRRSGFCRAHRRIGSLAVVVVLAALGCGDTADAGRGTSGLDARLTVRYTDGERALRATLECAGRRSRATGFLERRRARTLCSRLSRLRPVLVDAPPRDRACTQVYGGPDRATITGRLAGRRVRRRFARTDGCQIADWNRAQPILPRPAGGS